MKLKIAEIINKFAQSADKNWPDLIDELSGVVEKELEICDKRWQSNEECRDKYDEAFMQGALSQQQEVCVCAAVIAEDGSIYRGHRHGHCLRAIYEEGKRQKEGIDSQGFMTTANRYVTRAEGRKLQEAAGIKSADPDGYRYDTLFSEDLY